MQKKWCISVFTFTLLALVGIAILVYVIDPFFVYHKPLKIFSYHYTNEAYQVPGIARNFSYDSIVTGSSMTENFSTDYINQMFQGNTVKLCYSGATLKNQKDILDLALKRNNNSTKRVIMSMDLWNFQNDYDMVNNSSPQYLYDKSKFNDIKYLLNKDVLQNAIAPIIENTLKGEKTQSMDSAFRWWGFPYGDYAIFQQWEMPNYSSGKPLPSNSFNNSALENLNYNLKPLFEKYPEIDFYVFFPPYSILYWYDQSQTMDALMEMREKIVKQLLMYENVYIFDFQSEKNIITNLWNYKDTKHYSPEINDFMTTCFKEKKYIITEEAQIIENNNKLRKNICEWDIKSIIANPIWKINDINEYTNYLLDKNYIAYMAVNNDSSWSWTNELAEYWKNAGSQYNLAEYHETSYIAILDNGYIKMEALSKDKLEYDENEIKLTSKGSSIDGYASIIINNVEYSQNSRGLNIVVYDKKRGIVIDSICFDTCNGLNAQRLHGWR